MIANVIVVNERTDASTYLSVHLLNIKAGHVQDKVVKAIPN